MKRAFKPVVLLALLATPLIGGCGYSQGGSGYQWSSVYRQEIQTVAVPVVKSRSFSRGDELVLTKALVQAIESRTPYKVVPQDRADSVIEAEVTDVALSNVSSDKDTAIPQEQLYNVRIDFVWKDLRNGRLLVERRGFDQTATFYPTLGEGRFVGKQSSAEGLANGIVDQMQSDW